MKKLFLFILFIIGVFSSLVFAGNAIAQTQNGQLQPATTSSQQQGVNPQNLPMNTEEDVPRNLSTYTQGVFIEMISATSCLLAGMDAVRPNQPCLGFNPETQKLGYVESQGGAVGLMGGLIASTYSIPASSSEYFRYLAGNFGISQNARAQIEVDPNTPTCEENPEMQQCVIGGQSEESSGLGTGFGFEGLKPVLGIWEAMRNIVYLAFVLVFIVVGLGIMFRIQIDPRAVLSIQNQLPKIVIALILVTFSYAIAGFLVDMMYVSLLLIINIFQTQGLDVSTGLATNPINASAGLGGLGNMSYDASKGIASVMTSIFDGTFGTIFKGVINAVFGSIIGGATGAAIGAVGGPIGSIAGGLIGSAVFGLGSTFGIVPGPEPFTLVVGAIAWLIIIIALLSALFRLWFILLKTFVFLLINITFAPFWIVLGLFPGSSLSFGSWIRAVVSDLAAFPVVLMLFSLGRTLQNGFENSTNTPFVPPYVGNIDDISVFSSLIGVGMILLAPEAVNIAKSALKAPEFKYGSAIGRSLGTGQGIVGGTFGKAKEAIWHTNPYTNEPSRVKLAAKEKAMQGMGKLPLAGKIQNKIRKILPTQKQKEEDEQEAARKKAEEEQSTGGSGED